MSGHGGNLADLARLAGCLPEEILDFSANINPLGPPSCVRPRVSRSLEKLVHYPDPDCRELAAAISEHQGVPAGRIVVGNGTSEILHALARAVGGRRAIIPVPSYIDYVAAAKAAGHEVVTIPLDEHLDFAIDLPDLAGELTGGEMVFLGQPNNPTGGMLDGEQVRRLAALRPDALFIIDEAFSDFVEGYRSLAQNLAGNVVVLKSMTKFYAIPGLRLGYAVASEPLAASIRAQIAPWSVNTLAQDVGAAVLADDDYAARTREFVREQRESLGEGLAALGGLHVLKGAANFVLVRIDRDGIDAAQLASRLLTDRIAIRTFGPGQFLDGRFFRLAVRTQEENQRLLAAMAGAMGAKSAITSAENHPHLSRLRRDILSLEGEGLGDVAEHPQASTLEGGTNGPGGRQTALNGKPQEKVVGKVACAPCPWPPRSTGEAMPPESACGDGTENSARRTFAHPSTSLSTNGEEPAGPTSANPTAGNHPHPPFAFAQGDLSLEGEGLRGHGARKRRAAAIMFQGTSSNAGKSVLTAALCRILLQDGVRVAPFKAQNMSLNSFVTRDGGEMGRAQVVQARACLLEPDVRMNPILLKPSSDTGSQVILRGQPVGNMNVGEYFRYKPQAFEAAKECYESLAAEHDAIVLEGAGSPGEVNLKSHDIVNMAMARHAKAPVLIVGDIDRGGVYASFVGTMEVLDAWERALVAGFVVNRFRGDVSLLASAHQYVMNHTGKPVLGVVPFLPALEIPQEDSVEFKSGQLDRRRGAAEIEIAVIDLPHISNFTDFDALGVEPDVRVRIVRSVGDLDSADAIILPGSKNTLGDLAYLKQSGLGARIVDLARDGATEIVGICGGFQMIGREIQDPGHIESAAGKDAGLGLLPVDTILAPEKTLIRTAARHALSGLDVFGYEIHHGQTPIGELSPLFTRPDGAAVGVAGPGARVWGTYLHGVFDADRFRRWFIDRLRSRRRLRALGKITPYSIEPALDRLAEVVRASLDMNAVYRLLGLTGRKTTVEVAK